MQYFVIWLQLWEWQIKRTEKKKNTKNWPIPHVLIEKKVHFYFVKYLEICNCNKLLEQNSIWIANMCLVLKEQKDRTLITENNVFKTSLAFFFVLLCFYFFIKSSSLLKKVTEQNMCKQHTADCYVAIRGRFWWCKECGCES